MIDDNGKILKLSEKERNLKELQKINGVGKSIAEYFYGIGLHNIEDLKGKNPKELFEAMKKYQNTKVDRCMLYVLRMAVYFADNKTHDQELLKWWNWSDKNIAQRRS